MGLKIIENNYIAPTPEELKNLQKYLESKHKKSSSRVRTMYKERNQRLASAIACSQAAYL